MRGIIQTLIRIQDRRLPYRYLRAALLGPQATAASFFAAARGMAVERYGVSPAGLEVRRYEQVFHRFAETAAPGTRKQRGQDLCWTTMRQYVNPLFLRLPLASGYDGVRFSVILPTFNGASRIRPALDALSSQRGVGIHEYEIIVVDDGSTDETRRVVTTYRPQSPLAVYYIRLRENSGPAVARNVGIMHARGNLICFTDDDCVVPPGWLAGFAAAFAEHPEIAGAGGWYDTTGNAGETIFDRYFSWRQAWSSPNNTKSAVFSNENLCGNTANVCYRREALRIVGGFDPIFRHASLEDWELKIRMHHHRFSLLSLSTLVRHTKRMTSRSFLRSALVRGWARHLIFRAHGIMPLYFHVTLLNILVWQVYNSWLILTNPGGGVRLAVGRKFAYIVLSGLFAIAAWAGRYWIPITLLVSRSMHNKNLTRNNVKTAKISRRKYFELLGR